MPPSIRETPAKSENRPPASSTMTWTAARSQTETPTASTVPSTRPRRRACGSRSRRSRARATRWPRATGTGLLERKREHRVLDPAHGGDAEAVAAAPGSAPALGVPAAAERRGRDARRAAPVRPPRARSASPRRGSRARSSACRRSGRRSSGGALGRAVLLAEHGVAGALGCEERAERRLDRAVGVGHRRQVGLRLDDEVTGAEARERDRVGHVGEPQGEVEVGRTRGTLAERARRRRRPPGGRPSTRSVMPAT